MSAVWRRLRRAKLGLTPGSRGKRPCIVIVEAEGGRLLGFFADRVSEITVLRERDFNGVTARVNGRLRRVLHTAEILSEEEFSQIRNAALQS